MKKIEIGQKVKYIGENPESIRLVGKIFKVVAKKMFRDGSENYYIMSEDGYLLQGICLIHIELV